jgi:large subunit ribosomal protein L4
MKLKTFKSDGSSSGEKEFAVPSFEGDRGIQAIKEVVTAIRANKRFGTASTKTRAEVRGGGKKPFRQKGTGMARQGSSRSPLHSGGGVAMGPKPRDYSKKVNKKVKSLAFQRALFDRAVDGSLVVIKEFKVADPKTKLFIEVIKQVVPTRGSILIVDNNFEDPVILASRNIAALDTEDAAYLNTLQLSLYGTIVITEVALATLMQRMEADNS